MPEQTMDKRTIDQQKTDKQSTAGAMRMHPMPQPITSATVCAFTIPTDAPESDGTLAWDSTTLVLVELAAGDVNGIGYSYADTATAFLIRDTLLPQLLGHDAWATAARWQDMRVRLRNLGHPGICAMAIAAVDNALWDWKAKALGLPLAALLGAARDSIPVYGSGGFTSYDDARLQRQLGDWARSGMRRVKMKIGRHPGDDLRRVRAAREAVGSDVELFVDANGALPRKAALAFAEAFAPLGVTWFEEPVSSDDLDGLRLLRDRAPAGMAITAGEYGYDLPYFRHMLEAGAVDVLQADATRCGGISGFLGVAALCDAFNLPLSSHCAPALHCALCCAVRPAIHLEYFHDHARIEAMLFDGAPELRDGRLAWSASRPGLGLTLRRKESECFRVL